MRDDEQPRKVVRHDPPAKPPRTTEKVRVTTYQDDWGEHPATTAPTTTWESDSAASSSTGSSKSNPAHQFYGHRAGKNPQSVNFGG